MARGRRNAKREAALNGQIDQREHAAAIAGAAKRLADRWGGKRDALNRLSALSSELERLHKQEAALLRDRDELVAMLRETGSSWNALSARTKLSRQALMKRV